MLGVVPPSNRLEHNSIRPAPPLSAFIADSTESTHTSMRNPFVALVNQVERGRTTIRGGAGTRTHTSGSQAPRLHKFKAAFRDGIRARFDSEDALCLFMFHAFLPRASSVSTQNPNSAARDQKSASPPCARSCAYPTSTPQQPCTAESLAQAQSLLAPAV